MRASAKSTSDGTPDALQQTSRSRTSPLGASPGLLKPSLRPSLLDSFRALFFKPELRHAFAPPAHTPPSQQSVPKAKRKSEEPHKMAVISKRRRLGRQSLQEYLVKAGYDVPSEHVKRFAFRMVMILFLVLSTIIIALAAANGAYTTDILLFVLGFWTAVFAGVMLLVMAGTYFFLDYRIYRRTKEIEDVFPDFLQLSSSNIAAGMPVDRALWYAIRPGFGVLAKEMEEVAKATMTGEDLETSLVRFADKYNSNMIRRSINILNEGMRAGGEIAELLNKIALNIDDMKIMRKEMAANVTTYAIFITFAAVVIAPFLFALATELLIIITKITGSLDLASTTTIFSFAAPDPSAIWNFKVFSVVMLTVTTVFSAAIVSIIKHGRVMEGIKTMPVYAVISLVIYYIATLVLQNVFSAIV